MPPNPAACLAKAGTSSKVINGTLGVAKAHEAGTLTDAGDIEDAACEKSRVVSEFQPGGHPRRATHH